LQNYPIPKTFKHILKEWLKVPIMYQNTLEQNISGFPQGSIIGPSLVNFLLNKLENVVISSQFTNFDLKKTMFLSKYNYYFKLGQFKIQKALTPKLIQFADNFIIICNGITESLIVSKKVENFLKERGLALNVEKSKKVA
jgi:RNA-directed DNA polymerase